jgi:FAD/FMN-containing dehydrogenase/Fe-S oxidoreductase
MRFSQQDIIDFTSTFDGEFHIDQNHRIAYATDASAYRELPAAVAFPNSTKAILQLVDFANKHQIGLIPRTAGTSLAGQVVGSGIVVDVSRTFNQIVELNSNEKWVIVQPGVVRDELNQFLKPHGFLFGPETSTANRAMIGGMIGNNSCGSNSVMYGSTREHLLEVDVVLADGSFTTFKNLSREEFHDKVSGKTATGPLEQEIYQWAYQQLSNDGTRQHILDSFPDVDIPRRNTGYALDMLMDAEVLSKSSQKPFNLCQLIAGSEGTLCFITQAKLKVTPLPPPIQGLLCVHFNDLYQSLESTILALDEQPGAVELMDHYILDCTKNSAEHRANRFFIKDEPQALLVIQLLDHTREKVEERANRLIVRLKEQGYGYHFPIIFGSDCAKVWNLRKAGLGLLSNIPGDAKPAPVIEDTAVKVKDLPSYIKEFNETLAKYQLECVHYAHAGSGELHLRPILNLKTKHGNELFRTILQEIATLVKKYRGALSGEHGDGRLRGEFIPYMVGNEIYELFRSLKQTWDPYNLFNPNKIVDTPPMNSSLRYDPNQETPQFNTAFSFEEHAGLIRSIELCNGSGDCRKSELIGGIMCPTYMATKDELYTTRARANMLREHFKTDKNHFVSEEPIASLEHCISCKGCKKECPSSVDMAKIKAEFEHQHHQNEGIPLKTKLIGNYNQLAKKIQPIAPIANAVNASSLGKRVLKSVLGFSDKRTVPAIHSESLLKWISKQPTQSTNQIDCVVFVDEFTNLNDTHIGKSMFQFFERIGMRVQWVQPSESGRTFLSKGMLTEAKACAEKNVHALKDLIHSNCPLIGIEPSALLTFRDEYPDLLRNQEQIAAKAIAKHTFTFEEFIAKLMDEEKLTSSQFTSKKASCLIHVHCHQKALSSQHFTRKIMNLPANYEARLIPSGCCGMAGSFGYQDNHYDLSMKIGETTLFPAVREASIDHIIVAAGTSCRHQIKDGTERNSLHPVEALLAALKPTE